MASIGRRRVYIQSFPPSGGKWQVSTSLGAVPRWRGDGKAIYFWSNIGGSSNQPAPGDTRYQRLWEAQVRVVSGRIQVDPPRALFPLSYLTGTDFFYDVSADGQRFIEIEPSDSLVGEARANMLTVVSNWQSGLK